MTRGIGGTGLGLYICRELVRRLDGRIWVERRTAAKGSTFYVEMPIATRTSETKAAEKRPPPKGLLSIARSHPGNQDSLVYTRTMGAIGSPKSILAGPVVRACPRHNGSRLCGGLGKVGIAGREHRSALSCGGPAAARASVACRVRPANSCWRMLRGSARSQQTRTAYRDVARDALAPGKSPRMPSTRW